MDRPGTILYNEDLFNFKKRVEEETGFVCYEVTPGDQAVWYGISDNLDAFKELVANIFPTGMIVFCMDTGKRFMYYRKTNDWFQLN